MPVFPNEAITIPCQRASYRLCFAFHFAFHEVTSYPGLADNGRVFPVLIKVNVE